MIMADSMDDTQATNEEIEASETMAEEQTQVTEEQIEAPETAIDILKNELEKLRTESQSNLDGWQRSLAEFTNYKRRTQQQLADSKQNGALEALGKILPNIDDFERSLDNIPDDLKAHSWTSGTILILKNIQKILDEYDIEVLDPVGEEFDPMMHEAIGMDDSSDYDSGIVTMTLQKGYKSGDRILRPAMVRVAN
jgi:molecular chaperone GrpE